jgi:DNA-binding GntR family transcriptional regulator
MHLATSLSIDLAGEQIEPQRTLHAPLYDRIRGMILDGRLTPGSRIDEEAFSKALRVSRTPLREALHRLDHEGLATILPRRGAFVADFTKDEILQLLEFREGLEGFATRLASMRATPEAIRRFKELIDPAKLRHLSKHDPKQLAHIDRMFHELVYDTTGNRKLIDASRRINDQVHLVRLTTTLLSDRRTKSVEEISGIIKAIEHRDSDGAERLARQHVRAAAAAVKEDFPDDATLSVVARRNENLEG